MSQNKSSFLLILGILAVLVLAAVVLFTFRPDEQKLTRATRGGETSAATKALLEQLKTQEILGTANAEEVRQPGFSGNAGTVRAPGVYEPEFQSPENIRRFKNSRAVGKKFPSSSVGTQDAAGSGLYEQAAYQAAGRTGGNRPGRHTAAGGKPGFTPGAFSGRFSDKKADKSPFSPYLAALTKEQAASLNKQLDGLTDRVQAAVLRALLPKSKKDANIEKYLARHQGTDEPGAVSAQTSDKFAPVARQISRQKAGIVKSMQSAFGDKAAHQAGQIMDAYQKELSDVVNNPNLTPEQIQQKTQEISKAYNKKLQELSEKNSQERFKTDLEKRDNDLLAEYAKSYDSQICAGMGTIMDKYRAQELDLAEQGLNQKEYLDKYYKLQRDKDGEIRDFLHNNGQPEKPYLTTPGKKEENQEEKSLIVYRASKEEQQAKQTDAHERTQTILRKAQQLYGKETASLFEGPQKKYEEKVKKIWAEQEETTYEQKIELENKAIEEFNQEVQDIQRDPEVQTKSYLKQLKENVPAFKNAPPEEVAAFEEHARPILESMYKQFNDVDMDDNLSSEQKDQRKEQIHQRAMHQLSSVEAQE